MDVCKDRRWSRKSVKRSVVDVSQWSSSRSRVNFLTRQKRRQNLNLLRNVAATKEIVTTTTSTIILFHPILTISTFLPILLGHHCTLQSVHWLLFAKKLLTVTSTPNLWRGPPSNRLFQSFDRKLSDRYTANRTLYFLSKTPNNIINLLHFFNS